MDVIKIWTILGYIGTVATIETRVREAIGHAKGLRNDKRIQKIDLKVISEMKKDIKDVYLLEKLDEYIATHAMDFKEKDVIFSNEEKDAFVNDFLNRNLEWIPYQKTVQEICDFYLTEIEKYILGLMSDAERFIYREVKNNGSKLDEVVEQLTELNKNCLEGRATCLNNTNRIYTANNMYAKSFEDVLFLHKHEKDTKVTLDKLFVLQKYNTVEWSGITKPKEDLIDNLSTFLSHSEERFLFIEGDAGCGKSSLVAYLNYHYKQKDEIGRKIFSSKRLVTIRLRDIQLKKIKESGGFIAGILDYLRVKSIEDFEKKCPNAVILLDGFDELCMIEEMNAKAEGYIYDLCAFRENKIIITTRPKYILIQSLDVRKKHIALCHFDAKQRNEWLEVYINVCEEQIDEIKLAYLERISDEDAYGICDTPMALYMIVAGKIDNYALYNEWALYHQIFYKELSETDYNEMFPNQDRKYAHDIMKYRESIYRISEEIAYRMYCTENSKLYLSSKELRDIIASLGIENAETKELVERCYALCGYWKLDSDRGVVEFYHNNMRDFFLCEKIMREMNEIYEIGRGDSYANVDGIISNLCSLFQYAELETMVCKFILQRILYKIRAGMPDGFYKLEMEYKKLPVFFEKMLTSGLLYSFSNDRNPIQTITNVLSCVIQIYRHIYEPSLDKEKKIKWWNNTEVINSSGMLKHLFKNIFIKTPLTMQYNDYLTLASKADFSDVDFYDCDLRNAGFRYSNLRAAKFDNTILCGCDFTGADLQGATFTNADIHYAALTDAKLSGCDFTGVDLRGTELPDDFCSKDQEEQVEHLKSLGIKGLRL